MKGVSCGTHGSSNEYLTQETFADMEYSCRKKRTKQEEFLEIMDEIIP